MHFENYQDAKGEWRWRLVVANGKTIADSAEGYVDERDCDHGIQLLKLCHSAPTRTVNS